MAGLSQSNSRAADGGRAIPVPASYGPVGDAILATLEPPRPLYWVVVAALAAAVCAFLAVWIYQVRTGMGVAGVNHPVGWGVYIANFVFWAGVATSGTLISAILHLVRARWRDAVARGAETMTVFAVMTMGLFPLVHLGRLWVFYFILPYPSQRQLWPNFTSPLVWDMLAVSTYLVVSVIFLYVGMLPDLASARDHAHERLGAEHWRTKFYGLLSLGWSGAGSQWRHYGRGYLYFAALATPLVVSIHSVVSWDFAMSLLPGWHTTIFPPYFVAGAIHSGLAMVLTLMIPLRKLLGLEQIITAYHLEVAAKLTVVTGLIVGYAYAMEPFIAWYSGDLFERQFAHWQATGWMAWSYWTMIALNVLSPMAFLFRRVRRSLACLFIISILINAGMWLERYFIVVSSTSHDFLPHNWGAYVPSWVEVTITAGSFALFFLLYTLSAKHLPIVGIGEVRELLAAQQTHDLRVTLPAEKKGWIARAGTGVVALYERPDRMLEALRRMRRSPFRRLETFSPVKIGEVNRILGFPRGPVRFWTLTGALAGVSGGFGLAIGAALLNGLIVGGKPPVAVIPYCVVAFEGGTLLGSLANLAGLIVHARLGRFRLPPAYDRRFSRDRFGLLVECARDDVERVAALVRETNPEEVHAVGG
jgi:Ni/Fe-hydrogenase subunit HybB-like protein